MKWMDVKKVIHPSPADDIVGESNAGGYRGPVPPVRLRASRARVIFI